MENNILEVDLTGIDDPESLEELKYYITQLVENCKGGDRIHSINMVKTYENGFGFENKGYQESVATLLDSLFGINPDGAVHLTKNEEPTISEPEHRSWCNLNHPLSESVCDCDYPMRNNTNEHT